MDNHHSKIIRQSNVGSIYETTRDFEAVADEMYSASPFLLSASALRSIQSIWDPDSRRIEHAYAGEGYVILELSGGVLNHVGYVILSQAELQGLDCNVIVYIGEKQGLEIYWFNRFTEANLIKCLEDPRWHVESTDWHSP